MTTKLSMLTLAEHAMMVGDYELAFDFYTNILESIETGSLISDALLFYKINFELAIISSILRKPINLESSLVRLERFFEDLKTTRDNIERRTEKSVEVLKHSIVKKLTKKKRFDIQQLDSLLDKDFPEKRDMLSWLINPRYERPSFRTAIKRAKRIEVPIVYDEGIFRFSLRPQYILYQQKPIVTLN